MATIHTSNGGDHALPAEDFRALFGVLETAACATDQATFFDDLREGMARNLGWRDSVVVDIPAAALPFPARAEVMAHLHSSRPTRFLAEYVDRWYAKNPFKSPAAERSLRASGFVTPADLNLREAPAGLAFVEQYLAPNGIADMIECVVDGGGAGKALLCVYFGDRDVPGPRERQLASLLSRQLAPWLVVHRANTAPPPGPNALSPRERQVADLVAAGLSNREIAQRLYVSVDTVKKHLTSAMAKLAVRNRTQLALRHR